MISDFFKVPLILAIDLNGEKFPVPQYSILTKENYLELANLDFNAMLRSYKEMAGNPGLYLRATHTLLDLLSVYDESNDERKDLLEVQVAFQSGYMNFLLKRHNC